MAKPKLIDDVGHHFVKHCKKRELIREGDRIVGVFPQAFRLRPKDEKNPEEKWLSGQYLEFYDGTDEEKLCACCHFIPLEIKKSDALCRITIGDLKEAGTTRNKSLRVLHQGDKESPGYAGLHGLPKSSDPIDDELLSILATLAQSDLVTIDRVL